MRGTLRSFHLALALLTLLSSASASILYTSSGGNLAAIDTLTGHGTIIGPTGFNMNFFGSTFSPSGTFYVVYPTAPSGMGDHMATLNLVTGAGTTLYALTRPLMTLEFSPDGTMYGADEANLYQLNPLTGQMTTVGPLGFGSMMDLAFNSRGQLYAIADPPNMTDPSEVYLIDVTTGHGTLAASLSTPCLMTLAFDPADNLFAGQFCQSPAPLFRIDLNAGTATAIDAAGTGVGPIHGGDISGVPEPATWLALSSAFALIVCRRRKRAE